MIPTAIIEKALLDTHTNSDNYEIATDWIQALNLVNNYINNEIVQNVREDYFADSFHANSVIWQSEYKIVKWEVYWDWVLTEVYIKKINKVFVKYDTNATYFSKLEYLAPDLLEKDLEEYSATQSVNSAFFNVQDRSAFVYPAPKEAITDWVKLIAIYTPPEVITTSPETWFAIQPDKHYIYSLWMEWQIYKSQGKINEANNAKQVFEQELTKTMKYLKSRVNAPKVKTTSNLKTFR